MDEAWRAAQKDAAREKDAEKIQWGVERQFQQAGFLPGGKALLRLESCVKNFLGKLRVEPQAALVAQQAAFGVADLALDREALVNQNAFVETRAIRAGPAAGSDRALRREAAAWFRQIA